MSAAYVTASSFMICSFAVAATNLPTAQGRRNRRDARLIGGAEAHRRVAENSLRD